MIENLKKAKSKRKKSVIMRMVETELRQQHQMYADVFLEWVAKIDAGYTSAHGLPMDEAELTIAYTFFTKGIGIGAIVFEDEQIHNLNMRRQ